MNLSVDLLRNSGNGCEEISQGQWLKVTELLAETH
jgi:hypothetical protein